MITAITYTVLVLIGIFICVSVISVLQVIIFNKNVKAETFYEFPKELIEADYPDNIFFKLEQEEFEERKQRVFGQELP